MPLPVIAGTVRVSAGGAITGGGSWSNNWHIRRADLLAPEIGDYEGARDAFIVFYTDAVFDSVPAATTLATINFTPLDGTSGALSYSVGLVGNGGINPTAAQTAEVLTIRTAQRGRQNRGRIYLPAFVEEDWDAAGHISSTAITRVLTAAALLVSTLSGQGWELGVGSYGPYKNPVTGVLEVGTPHFTPQISLSMDNLSDVQRSRKN